MEEKRSLKANKNMIFTVCRLRWITWTMLDHICGGEMEWEIGNFYCINLDCHHRTYLLDTHLAHCLHANHTLWVECLIVLSTPLLCIITFTVWKRIAAIVPIFCRRTSCIVSMLMVHYELNFLFCLAHHTTASLRLGYETDCSDGTQTVSTHFLNLLNDNHALRIECLLVLSTTRPRFITFTIWKPIDANAPIQCWRTSCIVLKLIMYQGLIFC